MDKKIKKEIEEKAVKKTEEVKNTKKKTSTKKAEPQKKEVDNSEVKEIEEVETIVETQPVEQPQPEVETSDDEDEDGDTTMSVKDKETRKIKRKNLFVIVGNLVLALVSIYFFEFWARSLFSHELTTLQIAENIGVVALTALTYFIGKTFYTKGFFNNAKKIGITILLGITIVALMVHSAPLPTDMVYPISGIIVVSIAFYMLSLTSGTLGTSGILFWSLLFGAGISFSKVYGWIDWDTVTTLSKLSIFVILFIGGTWAQIRMALHGVRGVNKDGGGLGTSDNNGDAGDGDGDTGDED